MVSVFRVQTVLVGIVVVAVQVVIVDAADAEKIHNQVVPMVVENKLVDADGVEVEPSGSNNS